MAREFTDAEVALADQAAKELFERGVEMRTPQGDLNTTALVEYFDQNPTIPALLPNYHAAVDVLRDKLVWRSREWKEWDQLSRQNPAKAAAVTRWLLGGARTQQTPQPLANDVENALNLLKELFTWYAGRDFAVTTDTMYQAIYRIQSRGIFRLHIASEKKVDTTNHKIGVMFEGKPNRSFVEAIKQSRPEEYKPTGPTPEQAAEAEAEKAVIAISRDGRHSDQYELTAVMNRERNRGATWQETLAVMKSIQKERHQSRNRGEALVGR